MGLDNICVVYQNINLNEMGNQLVKGYSVDGEPVGSVGYCGIWKLYRGVK